MSTETKIAPTLRINREVAVSAAVAFVACTEYPYMVVSAMDWTVGVHAALVRLRLRVGSWLERRRLERAVARARVV